MKFKKITTENGFILFGQFYLLWLIISFLISVFWSDNIAFLYNDLPFYLRRLSKIFLSLAYLSFVVPSIVFVIGYGLVIIIFIIRNKN